MTDATATTNWEDYPVWQDATVYSSTLFVAQGNPAASDTNAGTEAAPLRTIQAALERVQPGQRILVRAGIYREQLTPRRGGNGPDSMIAIEAAPGEDVHVRGSRVLKATCDRPRPWQEGYGAGGRMPSLAQCVWQLPLDELTAEERATVLALNVEAADEVLMPWMKPVSGRPPYTLRRGLLFQDGQRLQQLHHAGDLPRVPGSYWFEPDGAAILLHPYGGGDPVLSRLEIAVQPHLLCPADVGVGYIRVAGITFEQCANAFLRAGAGAVTTLGGHHWIIERCLFRDINSAGLEFGDHAFENNSTDPRNPGRTWKGQGHVIARRNEFSQCGTAGIRCLGATEARVLDSTFEACGWQEAEYYFECAAIKLLLTRRALVAGNRIRGLVGACGIWLDWDNKHSRVTRNIIRDVQSIQGGIFVEASHVPNLVDRNVIWNVDGPGIFGGDSSFQLYLHNVIGRTRESPLKLFCHTDRSVGGRPVTCIGNCVEANVFVDPPMHRTDADDNRFAANVVVTTTGQNAFDMAAWQARGFDRDVRQVRGAIEFSESGCLRWDWNVDLAAESATPAPEVGVDFDERRWPENGSAVGPLALVGKRGSVDLGDPR